MKKQQRILSFPLALPLSIVIGCIFLLAACGGGSGAKTKALPPTGTETTDVVNYTGPVAANASVQAFKTNLWDNLVENDRCSACHGVSGQTPTFARNDDINAAYNDALGVVDLATPSQSRLVLKVSGGHNCWVADNATCGEIMTRWISEWAAATGGVTARVIVLEAPEIRDIGQSKTFPEDGGNFSSTVYPLLTQYCIDCHSENARVPQSPFFASSDVDTAYSAAKSKINLNTPADSRFVVRLGEEFHNCWSDCTGNANSMLAAIQAFADSIPTAQVDPDLITSKALYLLSDGLVANSGGRHENDVIALFEFKTGSGDIAYDTSGVSPALNLTISGDVDWVGGWGLRFNGGTAKAQGQVASSEKLATAIKRSSEYSIEAWVVPGNVTQDDSARIVSYSASSSQRNFTLGQTLYSYDFLHRSSSTSVNGMPAFSTDNEREVLQASQQHVVATYDVQNGRRIYVNGELIPDAETASPGSLNDWDENFALVLGNETSSDQPWQGVIRMLAIHDRALSLAQIQQNFEVGVGQKYYLLFNVEDLTNINDAYIVFQVSQFDDYSYLFTDPFFISLDSSATITSTAIRGMRIGINGKEATVGQAYRNLDFTLTNANYIASGTPLSTVGTIVAVEKGAENDEFFLSFEQFGSHSHVVVEADGVAPTPVDQDPSPDIGLRTFDEINATLAKLTTVSTQNADVSTTFTTIKQQLPTVENIDTFISAQQVGVAQLAIAYCDALVEDTTLRSAYFPGFNFGAAANTAFDTTGRNQIIAPLLTNMLGSNLTTQPDNDEVTEEVNGLIDTLTQCGGSCASDRTETVVKAACAAVLGSATSLLQ